LFPGTERNLVDAGRHMGTKVEPGSDNVLTSLEDVTQAYVGVG